jgi:hypothetical protein
MSLLLWQWWLRRSCADGLDGTLPRFTGVQWDRVMNCCHSCCLFGLRVLCCQVYTLARLTIDLNLRDTLGHG